MKEVIRFAVVGVSGFGKNHIKGLEKTQGAELVAVCDIREDAAKACAEQNHCRSYTDYRTMLAQGGFDAVIVSTPDQIHREVTVAALEAGYHVLCEKALALNMEDCRAIAAAAEKSDRKCMVGQVCRKAPGFLLAKDLIDKGEIGDLFFVESEYAHDYMRVGGVGNWRRSPERHAVIGGGCHAIDLLRWIAGDPTEVFAYANHKCLTDWPVDDCTVSVLRFPNQVIGKVMTSIGCKRAYTMRSVFYGTRGTIIADNTSPTVTVFRREEEVKPGKLEFVPEQLPVDINNHNVASEIDELCELIRRDLPVVTGVREGANTVAVCCAVVISVQTGMPERPDYL